MVWYWWLLSGLVLYIAFSVIWHLGTEEWQKGRILTIIDAVTMPAMIIVLFVILGLADSK